MPGSSMGHFTIYHNHHGIYAIMPRLVSYLNMDLLGARALPYRDNSTFFLNPNKRGYVGDRRFGEEILNMARKNSVIIADFTPYTLLKYMTQVEDQRADIVLMPVTGKPIRRYVDAIKGNNPATTIYMADKNGYYDLDGLNEKYRVKKAGPIFEIVPENP